MSFTTPWLLWALLAASLPVIIHLVNRWRHRSIKWGAMDFLLRAARETKGRKQLLHYIILALRTLVIALLVMAVARPLVGHFIGWGGSGVDNVVLLPDRSSDMSAKPHQTDSLLSTVPGLVKETLGSMGDPKLLLMDTTEGQVIDVPAPDALKDLAEMRQTDGGFDVPSLLLKTLDYVGDSLSGQTEIWLASDMQAGSWRPDAAAWQTVREKLAAMPVRPGIRVMALSDRPLRDRSIRIDQARLEQNRLILELHIRRFGYDPHATEELPLTVSINNAQTTTTVSLAGDDIRLRKSFTLPEGVTQGFGYVRLQGDDMPGNDVFYFTFAPHPAAPVVICSDNADMRHLIANMVAPPGLEGRHAGQRGTAPSPPMALATTALLVYQGTMPVGDQAEKILKFVRDGGIVLMMPDDSVEKNGASLLGVRWGDLQEAPQDDYFQVTEWNKQQGPLRNSVKNEQVPANRLQAVRRKALEGSGRVLARWNDKSPCLMSVAEGAGYIYFLNTLPKYTWSNLPDGHMFLPLLQRLADQGSIRLANDLKLTVGSPYIPKSASERPARLDNDTARTTDSNPKEQAGVYRLSGQTFTVNRPHGEDKPERINADDLAKLLPDATMNSVSQNGDETSLVSEAWRPVMLLGLLFLLLEAWLSMPKPTKTTHTPPHA